jgi:ADP-ribosylglycohydrolase
MRFYEQVHACWLGKAIGGTLGGPFEGSMQPLHLEFYDPIPEGILPNDDLDLQLVWLHHLRVTGARRVTPELLGEAWTNHVRFPFDEYGVCLRNRDLGLDGSETGSYDNWFAECMGAAIRSEIWACVAPGEPERAAGFAWCDAVCDHCGEGVWAEVFFAALQSAAFVSQDTDRLLDEAQSLLPEQSQVRRAASDTRKWWNACRDVNLVREKVLQRYGETNFTDVKANVAFVILGWLAGGGDFGKSLCIATNCGLDTDCTAATLGALLGILNPAGIPQRWQEPIGNEIVCSEPIVGITVPRTLEELTAWTLDLRSQLAEDHPTIQGVSERRIPDVSDGVSRIPLWIANGLAADQACQPPEFSAWEAIEAGGRWMELPKRLERGTCLRGHFEIDVPLDALVMAYSPHQTRVWLDGRELSSTPADRTCRDSNAPSFHRGGRCVFRAGMIVPEPRELTVWVDRPANEASELVLGFGDAKTRLWASPKWADPRFTATRETAATV